MKATIQVLKPSELMELSTKEISMLTKKSHDFLKETEKKGLVSAESHGIREQLKFLRALQHSAMH